MGVVLQLPSLFIYIGKFCLLLLSAKHEDNDIIYIWVNCYIFV